MKTCAYKKYLYMDVYSRGCNNPKLKQYIRAMESNPGLLHCGQTLVPGGSDGKASARNAGDQGLIPGSGRSPGEGNGNPLQHSCLENPMDGGA